MSDSNDRKHTVHHNTDDSGRGRISARTSSGLTPAKLMVVMGLMAVAFLSAYNFALARGTDAGGSAGQGGYQASAAGAAAGGGCGMSGGSGGGGCCGGGGARVEGSTTQKGDVQVIDIDTSQGSFNPNVIKVKAGVPIEMNFSQAPGGCLTAVTFPDFNITEDLSTGAKTVKLPALEKGSQYTFYCQMQMVSASIVVE